MQILTSSSLKAKMTLAISLLVSVILILVGGLTYYFWRVELKKTITTQQDALVSALAGQLDDKLLSTQEQLKHFSRRIDRSVLENPHRFQAIMEDEDDVAVLFGGGLLLISPAGKVIAEYPFSSEHLGEDRSYREYFKQTITTGKPVISSPYISTSLKKPTIAFTVPIFSENHKITAIMVGRHGLDSSLLFSSLRELKIGYSGYLYIIDEDRDMVLHPDPKRIGEVLPAGRNAGLDRALKGFEGTIENTNSKGVNGLTSFKHLKSTNWVLAANTPLAEAYAPLQRAKLYALFILAGGILLSISISRAVMARLIAPLHDLTRHVMEFPAKCGQERIFPISGPDEIKHLGAAFNGLVKQLDEQNRAMEDEKKFFGSLIQNAAAPLFVIDHTHTIIFWNNAMARLSGRSSFQMVGTKQQWEPFYPSKRPVLADLVLDHKLQSINDYYSDVQASVFQDGAFCAEGWYDSLGGERRYIYFDAAPIFDTQQKVVAAVETLQDITHRKLAQEAMNSQNLFLQEILDAIPNPVFYKDTKGVYIGCNKAFQTFLGRTRLELIGKTGFDVLPEDQAARNEAYDERVISEQGSVSYESHARRFDGESRLILQTKATFSRPDGSVGGVVGVFVDITEQRMMDEQIRKLSRAVEQSPSSIVITNLDGFIEYVNSKFCQSTGYTAEEVLGQSSRILKSGETSADNYAELWKTISSGNEWRGEFHNKRKDGSLYWEVASISPLTDINGSITGYMALKEDITARKEAEEALARTSKELNETQSRVFQQEKMASIGQLAAGVAHEINNPMGFISSNLSSLNKYVDRMKEFIAAQDEVVSVLNNDSDINRICELRRKLKIDHILNDTKALIAESQDGAGRVRRIVQDLKSFSRVDQAELSVVDINECLNSTINVAWNEIKYVATFNRDFGAIPPVRCYPQQLNQVFLNLLVNAAQSLESQGEISVSTWSEEDNVFISVSDTGIGMPPDLIKRIFEPFFTTKEVGKGTGLGLSISYDIVRKHNGEISVKSEPGLGTTFTVRLPVDGPMVMASAANSGSMN